jgi:hypothetical protein
MLNSFLFKWKSGVYHLLPMSYTHRGHEKILGIREIIVRFEFLPATNFFGVVVSCRHTVIDLSQDCCTFALNNKYSSSTSTKHLSADMT